jgi:hypothetical protein
MIGTVKRALHDGYTEWYDENIAPFGLAATDAIPFIFRSAGS